MSLASDDEGAQPWSLPDLLALTRRLRAQGAPAFDPMAELQAQIAREARLPASGGLIGSGYARYMADNAPPVPQGGDASAAPPNATGPVFGPQAGGLYGARPEIDPAEAYQVAGPVTAKPHPSSLDPVIETTAAAFNKMNQADPGDDVYLDPDWVKAMVRVESGYDRKAYATDPMQVNNAGDWDDYKSDIGLTKGVPPGQDLGIRAGIDWLESKAYHYDGKGRPTTFKGWQAATKAYNGPGDPHYLEKVNQAYRDIKAGR